MSEAPGQMSLPVNGRPCSAQSPSDAAPRSLLPAALVVFLIGMLVLLAGCRVDAQKDVDAVAHLLRNNTREPIVPADGTLSLRDAVALANAGSETLAIEGEAYIRSIVQKRRAVAAFLPTLNLGATYSARNGGGGNSNGNDGSGSGSSGSGSSYDANLDIPLELDFVLFDGGRNVNAYWRDVYLIERQRALLLDAQEQLIYDVAQVYYGVLRAEAQVRVLENSLRLQEERLRDTRGREQAGFARSLDVAQTEAQAAQTRVTLIDARGAVDDGRSMLQYLLNAPVESAQLTDLFIDQSNQVTRRLGSLLRTAGQSRSELVASDRAITAARRDVEVALGQYYPSVSINLSTFLYRETAPDSRTWDGLLQASVPIFSAGRIEADVREAWSFLREAMLVDAQARRRVRREIEQALRDIDATESRLKELDVGLTAAREAYRQAQATYEAGRGTNLERVAAQDVLLQAELAYVTEQIDQKLFRLDLLRATGRLREELLDLPRAAREPATSRPATTPTTNPEPGSAAISR